MTLFKPLSGNRKTIVTPLALLSGKISQGLRDRDMKSRLQAAIEWLYEYLLDEDGATVANIKVAATSEGIAWASVLRAKQTLLAEDWSHVVVSRRLGAGKSRPWRWYLMSPSSIIRVPDARNATF